MRRHFRRQKKATTRETQPSADAASNSMSTTTSNLLSAQTVASLPPPGLSGPSQAVWSPESSRYLCYVSSNVQSVQQVLAAPALYQPLTGASNNNSNNNIPLVTTATTTERTLLYLDMESETLAPQPLLHFGDNASSSNSNKRSLEQPQQPAAAVTMKNNSSNTQSKDSNDNNECLQEKLQRERQRRGSGSSLTQFDWVWHAPSHCYRLLVPVKGSLYIQDGLGGGKTKSSNGKSNGNSSSNSHSQTASSAAYCIHDKSLSHSALDAQLSPDATMVVWNCNGEVYAKSATSSPRDAAIQLTFGATCNNNTNNTNHQTATATNATCISHGVADFVAQEEMDRYTGTWWSPTSDGLLITRVDETLVPVFRIVHYPSTTLTSTSLMQTVSSNGNSSSNGSNITTEPPVHQFEDHRYPFAGKKNPVVRLAYIKVNGICGATAEAKVASSNGGEQQQPTSNETNAAQVAATQHWKEAIWFDAPREASEYLCRVHWLPNGKTVVTQWQNRAQNVSVLYKMDVATGRSKTLLVERSEHWINLHHMFQFVNPPIHPDECSDLEGNTPPLPKTLPEGSFSFLFASERTGYLHLYLYTYVPKFNGDQAILLRAVTSGDWVVEHIAGVNCNIDTVYVTGTLDSALERHLYAVPLTNGAQIHDGGGDDDVDDDDDEMMHDTCETFTSPNGVRKSLNKVMNVFSSGKVKNGSTARMNGKACRKRPLRLTAKSGMHSIAMDDNCRYFLDTHSDLDRPPSVHLYEFMEGNVVKLVKTLFDAEKDDKALSLLNGTASGTKLPQQMQALLPAPEIFSFPTADGFETLYAALYRPDAQIHGPGPYPLICAVYGGPHVQRVNRSWTQSADMRAQRLRNLGFCVLKCDNRGSSRRGLAFESAIAKGLGRVEVLDQVAAVQQLIIRGIADSSRVGIYGWSYGGYLAAMCLFRAPDVFHAAVAGAPVTSWDGYDTHYTERYMGLPCDNPSGYQESAVFDHVPNMRGKLMIVHGLIDENVHFRHSSRLINKLTNAGKDYDLLVFPDERHSPRRLRDRVYLEKRISDFFVQHLNLNNPARSQGETATSQGGVKRHLAGHL
ncbi:hypothetical protein MPSEU_000768400 [Mayamaea pseudoterrestris]|nr:hypothetical protein MPSEU_000768400 [Mayamaea pseudoterrestris]